MASFSSFISIIIGFFIAKQMLVFPVRAMKFLDGIFIAIVIILSAVLFQRILLLFLREGAGSILKKNEFGMTRLPFLERLIVVIIWVFGGLLFLSNIGFQVSSLLAGLGLGGSHLLLPQKIHWETSLHLSPFLWISRFGSEIWSILMDKRER